jgi:hypothetical protein
MPFLKLPISPHGPLVDLQFSWSTADVRVARQAGRPIPAPIDVPGIIDTGAELTCLDSGIVSQLNLVVAAVVLTNVPALGGQSFVFKYEIVFRLLHPSGNRADDLEISTLRIASLDLGPVGYKALIGRDVLELCDFTYRGPAGEFELNY